MTVSCANTAEPIEMQFWMLCGVGQGNMSYMGCRCPYGKGHFWGVWPVEKQCNTWDFVQKNWLADLNDLYVVMTCFCAGWLVGV